MSHSPRQGDQRQPCQPVPDQPPQDSQWIEVVYNRRRLHSRLGMMPPVEFEQDLVTANRSAGVGTEMSLTHAA